MKRLLGLWIVFFYVSCAHAVSSPIDMLQSVSDQSIAELRANRATLKTNPRVVYRIINNILLPHAAMQDMARIALGRNAWNAATPAQRAEFTREFTRLMVNTYSSALATYTDETIKFAPLREDYQNLKRVQVESTIIRDQGPPLSVKYRLVLKGSAWKVYDITVEGISILESFRSQFAAELSQGDLESLLQKLASHNQGDA